ncbi:MAG TPA: hypothetical protein DCL44_07995 [Elusimicrobia bacterium]|nr:hypothetical protein [Elusimicrobiota bacterium]
MKIFEYTEAKKALARSQKALNTLRRDSLGYKNELRKYIESLIAFKGHALCMDVKAERKKMARLLADCVAGMK